MQQLFTSKCESQVLLQIALVFLLKSATSSVTSSAPDILVQRSYKVRRNKPKALDIPHGIHIFFPLYSVSIFNITTYTLPLIRIIFSGIHLPRLSTLIKKKKKKKGNTLTQIFTSTQDIIL